jgi:hypothetical protein
LGAAGIKPPPWPVRPTTKVIPYDGAVAAGAVFGACGSVNICGPGGGEDVVVVVGAVVVLVVVDVLLVVVLLVVDVLLLVVLLVLLVVSPLELLLVLDPLPPGLDGPDKLTPLAPELRVLAGSLGLELSPASDAGSTGAQPE